MSTVISVPAQVRGQVVDEYLAETAYERESDEAESVDIDVLPVCIWELTAEIAKIRKDLARRAKQ